MKIELRVFASRVSRAGDLRERKVPKIPYGLTLFWGEKITSSHPEVEIHDYFWPFIIHDMIPDEDIESFVKAVNVFRNKGPFKYEYRKPINISKEQMEGVILETKNRFQPEEMNDLEKEFVRINYQGVINIKRSLIHDLIPVLCYKEIEILMHEIGRCEKVLEVARLG